MSKDTWCDGVCAMNTPTDEAGNCFVCGEHKGDHMDLYLIVYELDDKDYNWFTVARPSMDQPLAEELARREHDNDDDKPTEVYFNRIDEVEGYKVDLIHL